MLQGGEKTNESCGAFDLQKHHRALVLTHLPYLARPWRREHDGVKQREEKMDWGRYLCTPWDPVTI